MQCNRFTDGMSECNNSRKQVVSANFHYYGKCSGTLAEKLITWYSQNTILSDWIRVTFRKRNSEFFWKVWIVGRYSSSLIFITVFISKNNTFTILIILFCIYFSKLHLTLSSIYVKYEYIFAILNFNVLNLWINSISKYHQIKQLWLYFIFHKHFLNI